MSPRPRRNEQQLNLQDAIKETAWKQIAELGPAGLNLRAIGRSLQITAPAIYNYFPDRNALVSALVIDAFTSFGEALQAARDALPEDDHAGRFNVVGFAYRNWAIAYPHRFLLIFGAPLQNYDFSGNDLGPAPLNSFLVLVGVIDKALRAGAVHIPDDYVKWTSGMREQAQGLCNIGSVQDPLAVYLAIEAWAKVHGLTALEINGSLPEFLDQSLGDFWKSEIEAYSKLLFG